MGGSKIILLIVILILIAAFSAYQYIFSIYEVTFKITPDKLYADNSSTIVIEVLPINALGWKAPFRKPQSEFIISEGQDLITVIYRDNENGILKLKAKGKSGKVSITIKSEYSLFPSTVDIIIEPNIV
jgi:hypothetical protein